MEILNFEIEINASPEKVWSVLWADISFRQWTSAFTKGSFYEGTLEEGSVVKFLDPDNNGMYSRVEKNIPNEEMQFLHLGDIYEGIETPQKWDDATETYILEENEEGVLLKIRVNTSEEFKDFFEEKFPVALSNVKHLSENQL